MKIIDIILFLVVIIVLTIIINKEKTMESFQEKCDSDLVKIGAKGDIGDKGLDGVLNEQNTNNHSELIKMFLAGLSVDNGNFYVNDQKIGCDAAPVAAAPVAAAPVAAAPVAAVSKKYKVLGSYRDTSNRALKQGPHKYGYTAKTCQEACPNNKYFALQDGNGATGWCSCSDVLSEVTQYGTNPDCGPTGGVWCNYVFST